MLAAATTPAKLSLLPPSAPLASAPPRGTTISDEIGIPALSSAIVTKIAIRPPELTRLMRKCDTRERVAEAPKGSAHDRSREEMGVSDAKKWGICPLSAA